MMDALKDLPPDEQDCVASAMQAILGQPAVTSNEVRPAVMDSFEQVMTHSTDVLEYLTEPISDGRPAAYHLPDLG